MKIDLAPGDSTTLTLVVGHPSKEKTLIPAVEGVFKPYSMETASGLPLSEPLYIARIIFRGIGVNQSMWFSIWNWDLPNDYPVSIYGPMSLWKRTLLRLHLLGLRKRWRPYKPAGLAGI